ncbi:hypothetical protein RvY_16669 [Ramazzottius varieornatus]|uniref:Endonuclease/exonuclease/phosphatase domain-containing protein n=1 Tax=Ramazzottius varieornatus TaxID=947166 RepID=A0A1D1W6P5_RAMVA|nr:hypothetical protein RvY_16669 [Ramazzottius varieornatus]
MARYVGGFVVVLLLLIAASQPATAEKSAEQSFQPASWALSSFWSWITGKTPPKPVEPKNIPTIDVELIAPAAPKTKDSIADENLVICTWNIFRFGPSKFSTPDALHTAGHNVSRMDVMIDQIRVCDLVAIQEYMDVSQQAIELLRGNLTERTGKPWAKVLSPRVGKPNAEQYVYLYRGDRVVPSMQKLFPDDPVSKLFSREPFFTKFTVINQPNRKLTEFVVGTIHTAPNDAVREISNLVQVFDWAVQQYSTQDVMVLGDYNAGCTYVKAKDWPNIPLRTQSRFTWIVTDDMDTTSMTTHCAYDRAVYLGEHFRDNYVADSVEAPHFAAKFGLTPQQAKLVSDHRLVKMDFC